MVTRRQKQLTEKRKPKSLVPSTARGIIKKDTARVPLTADIGTYLKALRLQKGYTRKVVCDALMLTERRIAHCENDGTFVPDPARLRVWLQAIKCLSCYPEAMSLLRRAKTERTYRYRARDTNNEHIDRIIDAYEHGTLTEMDSNLLKMIAPEEYVNSCSPITSEHPDDNA